MPYSSRYRQYTHIKKNIRTAHREFHLAPSTSPFCPVMEGGSSTQHQSQSVARTPQVAATCTSFIAWPERWVEIIVHQPNTPACVPPHAHNTSV